MIVKKPQFTAYQLGVIAILEGGGRIDSERLPDGFWEGMLYDVNGEYFGLVPNGVIEKLVKCHKAKVENDNGDQKTYVAIELINGEGN